MQIAWELESQRKAMDSYRQMVESLQKRGLGEGMRAVQRQLLRWYRPLRDAIADEQAKVWRQERGPDRPLYGPLMVLLQADKLALLTLHELVGHVLQTGNSGMPTVTACLAVADAIQMEVNLCRLQKTLGGEAVLAALQRSGRSQVRQVNNKAKRALDMLDVTDWPKSVKVKLGAMLLKLMMDTATLEDNGGCAFIHQMVNVTNKNRLPAKSQKGRIQMKEAAYRLMVRQSGGMAQLMTMRYLPMLVEPRPWTRADRGAYLQLKTNVMRHRGCQGQVDALRTADLDQQLFSKFQVFEGLNALARTRWRLNTDVFDVAREAWRRGLEVGELPSQRDLPEPPPPPPGSPEEALAAVAEDDTLVLARRMHNKMLKRVRQHNRNLHSLRCDHKLKMELAEKFRDHAFYFPYNVDFRGRAYPVPPNLNHMGSDFSRGVLMFDEARPLGERGFYWLKIHCANLYGKGKMSFDERAAFVDEHFADVVDSAERPLDGGGWWKGGEKPWQCLAVCMELSQAAAAPGGPATYKSRLPVHQDGSCNGLQHYAALGRDEAGGEQVSRS
ncbi:unnamed protein product, partial [Phaeothamnion confervicola]